MNMNRRDALTTLGALAITPATALAAAPAAKGPAKEPDYKALAEAAHACIHAAEECIDHCITMLSNGDKSMADCFAAVRQMKPMCEALEELAHLKSAHVKAHAALCAKVCRECEKACKPHAEHPPCKACMEACARCATECEKAAA
jgi:Cys-rich four helix bundle protein (predicted Tat secretion target)